MVRHPLLRASSPARGFEGIAARPIRRVGEELVRSDLPLREPVNDRHAHVGVAPTRGGHLHVGDELGGVLLVAGLRHLHLVPLPLVAAVGHIRVVGRLQRVGGHLFRVLQGHGHLAFPSIVVIVPGAPVLVFAHMALLPQQPLLLQLGSSRAMEPVHQPVEVPGTDRKASPTLPRAGVLVVGRLVFFLQIAP